MKKNNPDNFIFGDSETNGIPSVKVSNEIYNISPEHLDNLASEFYGKIAESQLVAAGDGLNERDDDIIVAFVPDIKNSSDVFTCRRAFKAALESYRTK